MKKLLLPIFIVFLSVLNAQNVGIGTATPDTTAKLDIQSTTSGLLIPRMTMAQRDAINAPADGLLIYQTDNSKGIYKYNGTAWEQIDNADTDWTISGTNQYSGVSGNVGIGTTNPLDKLQVGGGRIEFTTNNDANGMQGTGVLEIANSLRLDGNEIITNENTALYIQHDNNGDVIVDDYTLIVDASTNRVGIGTPSPDVELHVTGRFKLVDGSEGIDKVLTSSNTGLASWQTLPTDKYEFTSESGVVHNTTDMANDNFVFGSDLLNNKTGTDDNNRFFFNKTKGAFRAGTADNNEWDDVNVGIASTALGKNNIASGTAASILGIRSEAIGTQAVAIGSENISEGNYSTTIGRENITVGNYSMAIGIDNKAIGEASFSIGVGSISLGVESMSIGYLDSAIGNGSLAMGYNCAARGDYATTFGRNNKSIGNYSTTFGRENKSIGDYSTTLGYNNETQSSYSFTFGQNNFSLGENSHIFGGDNFSDKFGSTIFGFFNEIHGDLATVFGDDNILEGNKSFVVGSNHTSTSFHETVFGYNSEDYTPNSLTSFNQYDRLFVVGNGNSTSQRNNAFTILKNGDVGINTSDPQTELHVVGSLRIEDGSEGHGKVLTSDIEGLATWEDPTNLNFDDGDWTILGNDVISSVSGNVIAKEMLIGDAGRGANFAGISNKDVSSQNNDYALLQDDDGETFINSGNNALHFRNNNTEHMTILDNGRVGIGTDNPTGAHFVISGFRTFNHGDGWIFRNNAVPLTALSGGDASYSMNATNRVAADAFYAHSDIRIKNIKGVSNSKQDLETLAQIKITNYTMKDTLDKGNGIVKKVIAQQVKEVYPQAVSNNLTEIIPNIYKLTEIENNIIPLKADVQVGDKVKLIFENGDKMVEVVAVNNESFEVSLNTPPAEGKREASIDLPNGQVFVYGKEVHDFHTVDYEALSMLNISATQELLKRIEQLEKENQQLKTEVSELDNLKAEVDEIKMMLQMTTKK